MTAYSEYVPKWERPVITALCKALLDRGYALRTNNGAETTRPTTKWTKLRPELGATGEDWVEVGEIVEKDGKRRFKYVGHFYLIYNNGSDHDPMVVISDYGWTDEATGEAFEAIWDDLSNKYE